MLTGKKKKKVRKWKLIDERDERHGETNREMDWRKGKKAQTNLEDIDDCDFTTHTYSI